MTCGYPTSDVGLPLYSGLVISCWTSRRKPIWGWGVGGGGWLIRSLVRASRPRLCVPPYLHQGDSCKIWNPPDTGIRESRSANSDLDIDIAIVQRHFGGPTMTDTSAEMMRELQESSIVLQVRYCAGQAGLCTASATPDPVGLHLCREGPSVMFYNS